MKKIYYLLTLLFIALRGFSTGGYITISSVVPTDITVCGPSKLFTFKITNPSAFNLTNVSVNVTMPTGLNYQLNSATNATVTGASTNTPTFNLANLTAGSSVLVTYIASANCDILNYLNLGLPTENNLKVNYLANSTVCFDNHKTLVYMVKQPNVSITVVTNQSYNGSIGGAFTRCITVTNGGTGELSTFKLTNTHGNGIVITAAAPGTWTSAAGVETYVLTGADFAAVGNGNNLFETGESITICETVSVVNCSSVLSTFVASWGCNNQVCQTSLSTANVVFPNFVPNLVITAQPAITACIAGVNQQQLTIINNGVGNALNTKIDIFQSTSLVYDAGLTTEIDVASITIQVNGGAVNPIAASSTTNNAAYGCLSSGAKGAFDLIIPMINAGDNVVLRWNTKTCCTSGTFDGWAYKASYQSICLDNYIVAPAWGRVYSQLYIYNILNNGSPSTITSGQTVTFNYLINSLYFSSPVASDAYLKLTYTVSPCYVYNPNTIKILNVNGTITWLPTSVVQVGNVITAMFSGSAPFNTTMYSAIDQAQLVIDLTANCTACASSAGSIGVGVYYSPSLACGCEISLISANFPLNLVCPVICEGLNFVNYSLKRTSYGLPDNNDDGLPDASGTLNFTKIKTSRAMYGDTVTSTFHGRIRTSATHPNWQFCYASSTITNGNYLTAIGGRLKIYRGAGLPLIATCNIAGVAAVLPIATFKYDLSSAALIASGGVGAGFVFLDNDSLVFEPQYKVTTNTGGPILPAAATNTFIVSDIANPVNAVNKFSCNNFEGNFSIIGYYYTNYGPDSYSVINCNQVVVTQNYYLSIGACCNNYAGGNLFPYEYRQWATIDTLKLIPPAGYKYIAANFAEARTAGTFVSSSSSYYPLTPLNPSASTLEFPVGQYFAGPTPSITPSDDGFYGVFTATLEPSCGVLQNVSQFIGNNWTFKPSAYLPQTYSLTTSNLLQDQITYSGPNIFLQSTLPNINATTNIVAWDISLSNISTRPALNAWFSVPSISGVNIVTVVDVATSVTLTPVGGIYQLGTLPGGSLKNYKLYGTYTSCGRDSIIVHAGWNCQGYPANLGSYPCVAKKITLTETPQNPLLLTTVITPATVVNLCDTASYEVIGTNVQLGSVYNLTVSVNIPLGVNIVLGSSQLAYPVTGPYITVSDPVYMGGTIYQYNISVLSPSIGSNGLPGILSIGNNAVKIKFNVRTTCGYTSGSLASFSFFGVSGCGGSTGQLVSLSSQLGIIGASTPYLTNTVLKSNYISPCNTSSILHISSENLGGSAFGTRDSLQLTLPVGVTYVTGSFSGLHNAPVNAIPVIAFYNNQQHLTWKLPQGVTVNDSTVFNINYSGDPNVLGCNISNFEAKTISSSSLLCTSSGILCGVNVITGGDTLPIFTYKSYLSLANASGYSIPNPPTGETAFVNFTINNTGETLNPSNPTVISYYNDVNADGVYNAGDVLISQHTANIGIPTNGSYAYTYSLNIPSGAACHVIAVLDTTFNHCSCTPSQIPISLPLRNFATDTVICAGQTGSLGYNAITGYTYAWTPATNLSSATVSNPIVTGINNTLAQITSSYIVTVNRNTCTAQDTANVTVNPLPLVTTTSNTFCIGSSGIITAAGASTYTWAPVIDLSSATGATVTASATINTSYSVVATDSNGCINTATTSVTILPLPIVTAISDTICFGAVGQISASGAVSYTWSPAATLISSNGATVTPNPTVTTVYNVLGTDGNGCVNSATTTVVVNPLPIIVTSPSFSMCSGNTGTLTASGANTYTWTPTLNLNSNAGGIVTSTTNATESYTVTATDLNTCVNSAVTTITVVTTPTLSVSSSSAIICPASSATLTVSGATNYTWMPSSTLSSPSASVVVATPVNTQTYMVTGANSNCTDNTQIVVTVTVNPTITSTSHTICSTKSATITASGGSTYTWSPSSFLNTTTSGTVVSTPPTTQFYRVNGSSPLGCIGTSSSTITVIPTPTLATSASSLMICAGKTTILKASGAASYTWSPNSVTSANSNTTIATPNSTTIYTVTGSNGPSIFGCISSKTINIIVTPLPIIVTGPNPIICEGQSTIIYATGGTTYTWSPTVGVSRIHDSTTSVKPKGTGIVIYTVTGTTRNCSSTATVQININALPILNAGVDSTINIDNLITLNGTGNTVVGFINASTGVLLDCNYCPTVTVNPQENTCYTLEGISSAGCRNTDVVCITVTKEWDVFIPNAFTPNGDLKNEVFIPMGFGIAEIKLTIFDRWGTPIFKSNGENIGWDGKNRGQWCEQGVYIYQAEIQAMSGETVIKTGHVTLLSKVK